MTNLTFLYYDQKEWEDDWGGDLIMYNSEYHDMKHHGIPDDAENYEIGRVKYKPNRLVIMNGAITHRHPRFIAEYTKENGFPFRTSMVVRGDKYPLGCIIYTTMKTKTILILGSWWKDLHI